VHRTHDPMPREPKRKSNFRNSRATSVHFHHLCHRAVVERCRQRCQSPPRASNASIRGEHLRDGALVDRAALEGALVDRATLESALVDGTALQSALVNGTAHQGALVDRAAAEDEGVVSEHVEGWWVGFSEDDVSTLEICGGRRVWNLL
jgi:hypothetical protein